ncbi:TPA: hypothetical protein ACT9LK_002931 [Legionella pneumophila]
MADFNSILQQIESWSLFELNRLCAAINTALNDPDRNKAIRRKLKIGMQVSYFCSDKNRLIESTIIDIRKTRVTVRDMVDSKRWDIPLYMLNLGNIDTSIRPVKHKGGIDRNSLKVGDLVGWNSKLGHDLYGVIEKLNPKMALVRLGTGESWKVAYSLLFTVMDGEVHVSKNRPLYIEGEVIR